MIFIRKLPPKAYRDYQRYREFLRRDFQCRCAYCLIQEGHHGGSANYEIDHHRPVRGIFGRPDLKYDYTNLYWTCRECNHIKSDQWPDTLLEQQNLRFLDPCRTEDDHDLHWDVQSDGYFIPKTNPGLFTIEMLRLNAPNRVKEREAILRRKNMAVNLELVLKTQLPVEQRSLLEAILEEVKEWTEPVCENFVPS